MKLTRGKILMVALPLGGLALLFAARGSSGDAPVKLRERIKIPDATVIVPPPPSPAAPPAPADTLRIPGGDPQVLTRPAYKRLILSGEGSQIFTRISPTGTLRPTAEGSIWLVVTTEDGQPFTRAQARDVSIQTLSSEHEEGEATLVPTASRPGEGLWAFHLPRLKAGSHFYRLRVSTYIKEDHTTFEGHTVVRAIHAYTPVWVAQYSDGRIWVPHD
ncbi:MAG: hypothetical protein M3347_12695 [Armatimonadota bacterium]|nr:hypothetical protein [Armatimonadota bacterium]